MSPHCQRCHKCPLILATRRTIQSHEKLQQCPLLPQNNLSRVELQSTSIVLNLIEIEKQSRHSFIILWCSPLEWRIRIISLCHLTVKNRFDYPFVCNACDNQLIAVWIEDKPIWHMTWKWLLCSVWLCCWSFLSEWDHWTEARKFVPTTISTPRDTLVYMDATFQGSLSSTNAFDLQLQICHKETKQINHNIMKTQLRITIQIWPSSCASRCCNPRWQTSFLLDFSHAFVPSLSKWTATRGWSRCPCLLFW